MKVLLIILLVLLAVILFALFGPSKPQPSTKPAQAAGANPAATVVQQRPTATATAPQPALSPRQRGELSTPALATGVTTETVDVGGGGATFEAKRRMTDKLNQVGSSGKKH